MGIRLEQTAANKEQKKGLSDILNKEISLSSSGLSDKLKEQFYSRLSILLHSGISLKKALELICEGQKKQKHVELFSGLTKQIVEGKSLYQAMEGNNSFTSYEYQAIKIGEQTGTLSKITSDLYEFYNSKNDQKRQVLSALSYPIIILVTVVLVVFFMMEFVVPMFVDTFKQNNVELPWITAVIVDLSNFISSYSWIFLLAVLAVVILRKRIGDNQQYKKWSSIIKLRTPRLGSYIKKVHITRFVQAMALLSSAKLPLTQALKLASDMTTFYPLKMALIRIEKDIISGVRMSQAFEKHQLFDKDLIALLKVAEETNQTQYVFQKLFEQYSQELKYSSQMISSLLNPIFIFLVAGIVGVILVAMYLPMFKLSSVVGG